MTRKATIGIDCLFAVPQKTCGLWVYAKSLLEELTELDPTRQYIVFLSENAAKDLQLRNSNVTLAVAKLPRGFVAARLAYQNTILPLLVRSYKVDLLHSLGNYGPIFPQTRLVVTLHDLLPFFDRKHFPKECGAHRTAGLHFLIGRSVQRAERILVVSAFVRKELLSAFAVNPEKVRVVPNGFSKRRVTANGQSPLHRYAIRKPYLLAVGLYPPHKNIARLIQAFSLLKRQCQIPHQLVLAGEPLSLKTDLSRLVREEKVEQEVVLTGYVPDGELAALYQQADLFVFPSLMEGFGLPALEAMAYGTPVVCAHAGPLPEVVENAALTFDPGSVPDMADSIRTVLRSSSLRQELIERGRDRVKLFSYRKTAEATLAIYGEVLG